MQNTSEVQQRILDSAKDLFITNGYKGTSVRDIAAASDTSVAMVNYYFRSKYNLFEIIFEDAFDILAERVFSTITSDLPFFELIEIWINSYYEVLLEHPYIPIFILKEINQDPKRLMSRFMKREPYNIYWSINKRINEEVAMGHIKDTPVPDFLLNIISLCVFPFMFRNLATTLTSVSNEEYNKVLETHKSYVVEFIINALKTETAPVVNENLIS